MAHHPTGKAARGTGESVEDVQIAGHIIDSLILPKILDLITAGGGSFRIKEFTIGQARSDPSFALVEVRAGQRRSAGRDFGSDRPHGAVPVASKIANWRAADIAGAFPEGFYSTTNQRTEIRLGGQWIEVDKQEMDCAIAVDPVGPKAYCVAMCEVRAGDGVRHRARRRAGLSTRAFGRAGKRSNS